MMAMWDIIRESVFGKMWYTPAEGDPRSQTDPQAGKSFWGTSYRFRVMKNTTINSLFTGVIFP